MALTAVHLLRHGEVHNPARVLYGRLPGYHLSERGHAMARLVADTLAAEGADVVEVVASPLQRAQETAAPVGAAFGLQVGTDERLIEADNHFEGLTFASGRARWPGPSTGGRCATRCAPRGGEPYAEQAERVLAVAREAAARNAGHETVLVAHQLPIYSARRRAEGRRLWHDPRKRECTLASLTTLRFDGTALVGVDYREPAASLLPGAVDTAGAA
ncbi:histidine phosphatase family protein [Quadrisphaera sp. INWT6]|uniref:histidine phosphatase family protein n=1 Tax=Quadrisphaera sp. INWT6 TaxID=2596917 RepID=UPI00189274D7|nr:histidine phosphatase family protein [Quadrisphaera sp. INWT6]MBF5081785.1 histidine phosphatase family protein [Quadrisphaera sp. INWT6]